MTVSDNQKLTLEPGVVVKFESASAEMLVSGTLNATGTSSDKIVFTSIKDDTHGGDTNNDGGATSPAPGDWGYIRCYGSGTYDGIGIFEHCILRYGGNSSSYLANVYSYQSDSFTFKNSVSEHSERNGIYLSSTNGGNISSNTITNNSQYGIRLTGSSNNTIYNNYFNNTNNAYDNGNNIWNITKTEGKSIIGGPYLGGNYWSDYTGVDVNSDGLGDTPYDIPGGTNKDYLPLVAVTPKPTISIYTDKTSYTAGEVMHLGLDVKNPLDSAQRVSLYIYLELPTGGTFTLIDTTVTLPAGLDYSNPNFKVFRLPSIPAGTYTWHAILVDAVTGEIICEDTAEWKFVGRESPIEIADIAETFPTITEIEFKD